MIDRRNFKHLKIMNKNTMAFENLQMGKEMIIQLVLCQIILISKQIMRRQQQIQVSKKSLKRIQKRYNNIILFEIQIEQEIQYYFSFQQKQKKQFLIFYKELVLQILFALILFQYKMTQYYGLNVKLFNSKLNKLKSVIKKMLLK